MRSFQMRTGQVRHVTRSHLNHQCDWCDERIKSGQSYFRWPIYENGTVSTCKLHPECYSAMELSGVEEWSPGEQKRGEIE